ncbi:hypothetical protein CAPTEDRAFT_196515 [Capitella teleta]|uniref:Uncharacterized protein n=1 Tax=Capitella teleta TaxID=283909 RepID=R7VCL4_CAPTE|nr:hypothetical protein CAPTEDRAFT_196515 [Capitella teleta]|eukprot:ELU13425.1 hypothetical protein CAPTEDRAFT_196515 [Capitella teleta]
MSSNERPCMFIEFPTTIYIVVLYEVLIATGAQGKAEVLLSRNNVEVVIHKRDGYSITNIVQYQFAFAGIENNIENRGKVGTGCQYMYHQYLELSCMQIDEGTPVIQSPWIARCKDLSDRLRCNEEISGRFWMRALQFLPLRTRKSMTERYWIGGIFIKETENDVVSEDLLSSSCVTNRFKRLYLYIQADHESSWQLQSCGI